MEFAKLHALGNDFLIVRLADRTAYEGTLSEMAVRLCHRRMGVGADGVLFYQPTVGDPDAEFSTVILNSDGSRAEISGNGIRCLAAFLVHAGLARSDVVRIRTVSGIRRLTLQKNARPAYWWEAEMGEPEVEASWVGRREGFVPGPFQELRVGSRRLQVTLTSLGNPHCTIFWERVEDAPVEELGPLIERLDWFPRRTNVEFVQVLDRHRLRARFWERGSGPTLSSGSGSSAAAVASILRGFAESPVTVETELGFLEVTWQRGKQLRLAGPAVFVCAGVWDDPGTAREG